MMLTALLPTFMPGYLEKFSKKQSLLMNRLC